MPTPKYEREIRSILDKMPTFLGDGTAAHGRLPKRPSPRRASLTLRDWWARDAYIMASLLIVLARFGGQALGAAGAAMLAWLAALLIIFAAVISVVSAFTHPQPPRMWRGNILDYPTRRPTVPFTDWWRRWTRGGRSRF